MKFYVFGSTLNVDKILVQETQDPSHSLCPSNNIQFTCEVITPSEWNAKTEKAFVDALNFAVTQIRTEFYRNLDKP